MTPPEPDNDVPDLMPVRRLHNYVYCPRLFYLQWVEDIFVPNEDTVTGSAIHKNVDIPDQLKQAALPAEGCTLRSLSLSSESLGLTGTIDLIKDNQSGQTSLIDYKKGHPLKNDAGEWEAKLNDQIQIAAYALLLKENGINAESASIYYAGLHRHIPVTLSDQLCERCLTFLREAREVAAAAICPPPLCHAARCLACSAYPVCLPYESRFWTDSQSPPDSEPLRPPMPPADAGEILIVQNPQAAISLRGGEIIVKCNGESISKTPVHQLQSVYLYGAVQISAQALNTLMQESVPVAWFSPAGRFIGMAHGLPCSGVDARMGQTHLWNSPERRLKVAAEIIRAKIHNQRVILMRNGQAPESDLRQLARLRDSCTSQTSLQSLRGIEGTAAAIYFSQFHTMLKADSGFLFQNRNKRPPRDPVNALLSLAYSILSKELTGIAHAVGLDPFLGFFHSPRYGRPALALDMMEEFRPLIADSAVITLINRGEISPTDFTYTTKGVIMKDSGRRQFWRAWVRRLDTEITHPAFGYKMSYRRMLDVQMRQFWRFCRGDSSTFHGFTTR